METEEIWRLTGHSCDYLSTTTHAPSSTSTMAITLYTLLSQLLIMLYYHLSAIYVARKALVQVTLLELLNNATLSFDTAIDLCYDEDNNASIRGLLYLNDLVEHAELTPEHVDKAMATYLAKLMDIKQHSIALALHGFHHVVKRNHINLDNILTTMISRANSPDTSIRVNGIAILAGFAQYNLIDESRIIGICELIMYKGTADGEPAVEYVSIFGLNLLLENQVIPATILHRVLSVLIFKCINSSYTIRINAIKGIHTMLLNHTVQILHASERVVDLVIAKCHDPCNRVRSDAVCFLHDLLHMNLIPASDMEAITSIALARCEDSFTSVRVHAWKVVMELSQRRAIPSSKIAAVLSLVSSRIKRSAITVETKTLLLHIALNILQDRKTSLMLNQLQPHAQTIEELLPSLMQTADESSPLLRYYAVAGLKTLAEKNFLSNIKPFSGGDDERLWQCFLQATQQRYDPLIDELVSTIQTVCVARNLPAELSRCILCYVDVEDPYDRVIVNAIYGIGHLLLMRQRRGAAVDPQLQRRIEAMLKSKSHDRNDDIRVAAMDCSRQQLLCA
jgi:hypothetical protein